MQINNDISLLEQQAIHQMEQANLFILSQLQQAVDYERHNHRYHNRTGSLENSTQVKITQNNLQMLEANIEIAMEYAPYVYAKGLMVIDLAMEMAQQNIDSYMEQFGV